MQNANERQVGGTHYAGTFQHWDFVAIGDVDYFTGQVTKYLSRYDKKGQPLQDVDKAMHYAQKLLELRRERRGPLPTLHVSLRITAVNMLCDSLGLPEAPTVETAERAAARRAIVAISCWQDEDDLRTAIDAIDALRAEVIASLPAAQGYVNQDGR